MKSKKSGIPILSALLRIIIAIVLVFIFFKVSTRTLHAFSDKDDKVVNGFEEFANGIIDMSSTAKRFEMEFKKGSAIIGFGKGSSGADWQCFNCHTTNPPQPSRAYIRPTSDACVGSACVCLCLEGFNFDSNFGKCPSALICKALKREAHEKDIKEITIIKSSDKLFSNDDTYWKNGFLFANEIDNANGLPKIKTNKLELFVDNNNGVVSVCTGAMRDNNQNMFGNNRCTTPP